MKTFYHVTSYRNWPEIRRNGLGPGPDGKIWLWDNVGHAVHYADAWSNPDVPPCIVVLRSDAKAEPTHWGDAWTLDVPSHAVYDIIRPGEFEHYAQDAQNFRGGSLSTEAAEDHSEGAMLALKPSEALRKVFFDLDECSEDLDELHITLAYLGKVGEEAGDEKAKERLLRGCYDFALNSGYRGLSGHVNGWGNFINPDASVLIALWDIPGIAEFRTHLLAYPKKHGYEVRKDNHGFTPHMTIAYADDPIKTLPVLPEVEEEHFTSFYLVWGEEWIEIPLA